MPAYRVDAAKDSEIRFLETAAGAPRAINAWWYVGDNTGYQFIYSKQQLADLNRINQPEPVAAAAEESVGLAEGEPVAVPRSPSRTRLAWSKGMAFRPRLQPMPR
jgi:hypothetical protein